METLLRYLQRRGFRRGIQGGSSLWLVLAATAWMLLRERRGRSPVVYRTVLEPGEGLVIETRPPGRRGSS